MSASDEESFEDVLAEKTILIDKKMDNSAKNSDATDHVQLTQFLNWRGGKGLCSCIVGADMSFEDFDFSDSDF